MKKIKKKNKKSIHILEVIKVYFDLTTLFI